MKNGSGVASVLLGIFIALCLGMGLAHGEKLRDDVSLTVKTSKSTEEAGLFHSNEDMAKAIVTEYLTELIKKPEEGVIPLASFSAGRVDAADPKDIKVSVILTYQNGLTLPPVDYSVIQVGQTYQIQEQVCVYDADPESPSYGTIHCNKRST